MKTYISEKLKAHLKVAAALHQDELLQSSLEEAAQICIKALRSGGKILFCGNGGSASDAQHLAAELSGRYLRDRPPLFAEALHVNTSYLTAVANDYDFTHVYERAVWAKGKAEDVLIALSTSGNSENIIKAVQQAHSLGLHTIGMTGSGGGALQSLADICLCVPSVDTPHIQECHIILGHILCGLIEDALFPGP